MAKTELEKALEHYRIDSGKTSSEIAEALGVTRVTLWSKARGDTPLSIKQAKTLADMLCMSLEDFYKLVPQVEQ